ncbi:hypothetical protein [Embleya sp. NBC_00896]|uniref:hypothetical protein n=1 Tax=Embleya sp. NBC_00896 TaxID=2975961 RepID=UPI00386AC0B2|nr:hypothetical protein OG928_13960 [Embleya sp. NBC_00896]
MPDGSDSGLSPLARRVLACMLAVPEGIKFTGKDLTDVMPEGPYRIQKALRELGATGHRTVRRLKKPNGQFYVEVEYHATPVETDDSPS